jgi:MarR family transcriptional regulator, organic hydroperoxide resistance regulator
VSAQVPAGQALARSQQEYDAAATQRLQPLVDRLDLASFEAIWLLHQAADAARRRVEDTVLAGYDLTWSQFEVLWHLWIFEQDEPRHISRAIGIPKSSLTVMTTSLVQRGLVRRDASPSDGRLVRLRITHPGAALMTRLFPDFNGVETQLTRGLTQRQKGTLASLLRAVIAAETPG